MAEPGPLVGRGRRADVYALPGGRVLRRYRDPGADATYEAQVMRYVAAAGVPVPAVHDAAGPDLVLDRVDGPTMLADLGRRPHRLAAHARTLAAVHALVHAVPAQPWLRSHLGPGPVVFHSDLHPDNVLLGPDGPVVIDWQGAGQGSAATDVGLAWVILTTSEIPGSALERRLLALGRSLFVRSFLTASDVVLGVEDRRRVLAWRHEDTSLTDGERRQVRRLLDALPAPASG